MGSAALPAADLSTSQSWSRFRGENGTGISGADVRRLAPLSPNAWKVEVPFGRSSPVVGESFVVVTAVEGEEFATYAFDRKTGETRWRRTVPRTRVDELYSATDSATPTPVVVGDEVYAFFQESGLVAYDAGGEERWRHALGPFRNFYGIATSPIVSGDRLYLVCDQAGGSFVIAVDRATGELAWKAERPKRLESYATPVLYPNAGEPELLLVAGSRFVDAYELASGELAWSMPGIGAGPIASPVLDGDDLFIATISHTESGWPSYEELLEKHDGEGGDGRLTKEELSEVWLANHFGWVDVDGDGWLTAEDWAALTEEMSTEDWGMTAIRLAEEGGGEVRWNYRKNVPYMPTPLADDELVYTVNDGVLTALERGTGEVVKRGRLSKSSPKVYASPVMAGDTLWIATLEGSLFAIEPGRDWSVLEEFVLGGQVHATPAVTDGGLYVRTKESLRFLPAAEAIGAVAAIPLAVESDCAPEEQENVYRCRIVVTDLDRDEVIAAPTVRLLAGESADLVSGTPRGLEVQVTVSVSAEGQRATLRTEVLREETTLLEQSVKIEL